MDLEPVVEQTFGLVRAQKRDAQIGMELESSAGPTSVHADASVLVQILLNLVLNAADAVAGRPEPRIAVSLRRAHLRLRAGADVDAVAGRRWFDAVEC